MQIITVGGFKGGTGKTTLATLVGVAATFDGYRVAGLDLDPNTRNFGSILTRRRAAGLAAPDHVAPGHIALAEFDREPVRQRRWLDAFTRVIGKEGYDILVIDTGSGASDDLRRAHFLADTILTPMNDSPGDLHGLFAPSRTADAAKVNYRRLVETARYEREAKGLAPQRWQVCRNRVAHLPTRIGGYVEQRLDTLAAEIGFNQSGIVRDRVAHRAIALEGRTVFDAPRTGGLTMSELAGRSEARALLGALTRPERREGVRAKIAA